VVCVGRDRGLKCHLSGEGMKVMVNADDFEPGREYKVVSIRKQELEGKEKELYEVVLPPGKHVLVESAKCKVID
jgi:hypothetical protein